MTHSNNTLVYVHKMNVTTCTLDTVRIRDNVLVLQLSKYTVKYKYMFTERDLTKTYICPHKCM